MTQPAPETARAFTAALRGVDRRPLPPPPRSRVDLDPHDRILVVDIETVRDPLRTPADLPADAFPKPAFHQIVCISYATARIMRLPDGTERHEFEKVASGGEPGWDEARLVGVFWRFFAAGGYRLVTWNGRRFDMAVLRMRALLHGIALPAWYLRGDRWSNYGARYRSDWHADVMECLSDHGASAAMGLDECAALLGAPGKIGGSGGGVADQVARGELDAVRAYCECDVLNTLTVYWRWCHLSGRMTAEAHDTAVETAVERLTRGSQGRPHLRTFLQGWTKRRVGNGTTAAASPAHPGTDAPDARGRS